MSTPVNIQIPPGSVPNLNQAAAWHTDIADTLEQHQRTLVGTSFKLATSWEGTAAAAYQEYSEHVSANYGTAADQAREIAGKIAHWAKELEADQQQSKQLLKQATAKAKAIDAAKTTLAHDQATLRSAQANVTHIISNGVIIGASNSPLIGAEQAVSSAQAAVTRDQRTLKQLEAELTSLEQHAARIFQSAEQLARTSNAYLSSIHVTPPALLHASAGSTPQFHSAAVRVPPTVPAVAAAAVSVATGGGIPAGAANPPGSVSGGSVTIPPVVSGPIPARIEAMVKQADALLGQPYVWGGGHGGWGSTNGYDCSGFVSKVLHAGGFLSAPQDTTGIANSPGIANGPGHYVTIYDRTDMGSGQDHVIIDINGQFYECGGQAGPWGGGGGVEKIGHPSAQYLASFNRVLHPQGM